MKRISLALALTAIGLATPALAQGTVTESYCAFLSVPDHMNSKGVPLSTAAQIIRQDRANFHRFNIRDDADDWDSMFADANNRARLEKLMTAQLKGTQIADYIVKNETFICVDIIDGNSSGFGVQLVMGE